MGADLRGIQFGGFEVVEPVETNERDAVWRVRCGLCGAEKLMTVSNIRRAEQRGRTNRCRVCERRPGEVALSWDYSSELALLAKAFICGRFKPG